MSVNPLRVRKLSEKEYSGGLVVYQMCRDIRANDNDALVYAQELALSRKAKLIVNYVIWNYEWEGATRRFYDWVLPSLQEVEATLRSYAIPLVVTFENKNLFDSTRTYENPFPEIGALVIDQLPLRFMRKWKEDFLKHDIPLYEVDTHNCIPVWEASSKQEFAARTIRTKIHSKLKDFLEDHPKLSLHHENEDIDAWYKVNDWGAISSRVVCKEEVQGVGTFIPGEKAAQKMLADFLNTKLDTYDSARNDFGRDGQSNLSPYISHGNISRRRIIADVLKKTGVSIEDAFDPIKNGSNGEQGSTAAFIEECVVRAELSDNFCFYNDAYDKVEGFPLWAKDTLKKAEKDTREYVYTLSVFEEGRTHDALWNAAQIQLVRTGKMHGYMRMYWAKKILEWTTNPKEAMNIAVYLNDTYELDGRDPNGYVGCAWSIGGVHDRPWFPRPVFGTIRYMAEGGAAKRGDISLYVKKWLGGQQTLL